jgi:hypothetical protein
VEAIPDAVQVEMDVKIITSPVAGICKVGTVMLNSLRKASDRVDIKSLSVKLTSVGEKDSRTAI